MALIERETLKICKHGNGYGYCFLHEEYCPEGPCKEEDLVEYAPVVHGRWIRQGMFEVYMCSVCGEYHGDTNYCPGCGTRMDGGEKHEAD